MNITLTEEELKSVSRLFYQAMLAAVLGNDYFSYEKEKRTFPPDLSATRNAIMVLAREHSITVDRAKQVLAEKILAVEQEFRQIKGAFDASQPPISKELQNYISGIEMMVSGSFLWYSSSSRYHNPPPLPVICLVDLNTLTANQSCKMDLKITQDTRQENGSTRQIIYRGVSIMNLDDEVLYKF